MLMKFVYNQVAIIAGVIFSFACFTAQADAKSDVDRNIKIIFPPEVMEEMVASTTPQLISNLKFTDSADKSKTENSVTQFHKQYLQTFQTLVTASLKENFTPEELAEWARFQTSPLGKKTMVWLRTKYPDILNKSMDAPMKGLLQNLGQ